MIKVVRFFWLALFALFVAVASYLAEELVFPLRPSFSQGTIEWKIHQDLNTLKEQSALPKEFNQLHQVFLLDHRKKTLPLNWNEISKFHFEQRKNGQFDLQIEAFDEDGGNKSSQLLILQFSLFDKNSKNKVWELSRSYKIQK